MEEKNNYYGIIAIVAIVALVGAFALFSGRDVKIDTSNLGGDSGGKAIAVSKDNIIKKQILPTTGWVKISTSGPYQWCNETDGGREPFFAGFAIGGLNSYEESKYDSCMGTYIYEQVCNSNYIETWKRDCREYNSSLTCIIQNASGYPAGACGTY
ncbi:hypothetical protein JW968_03610 [Candidatus Woesearchaeota archaeon]|nr:hypothetical protein [Candidatus Woesearchaeota archaeon]